MSLRFLTAGESHGKALVGIVDGMPSGMSLEMEDIHSQLRRRKLGFGRGARQKIESDAVEFLSGVRHGKTLGSPIALMIVNQDWNSWKEIMQVEPISPADEAKRKVSVPRPGHADLIGGAKYQHTDMRNVLERSSARETAIRVGLGAIARKFLKDLGVEIGSRVVRIGSSSDPQPWTQSIAQLNTVADTSPVRCTNREVGDQMIAEIEKTQTQGDTLGGEFEVYASGVPLGLGSYVQWDRRLEAEIGKSFLSLNAIKGVEIGLGFQSARLPGSLVHDELYPSHSSGHFNSKIRFKTNRSGGIDGGMSTTQPLIVRAAMKPLSTLMKPLQSVHLATGEALSAHVERSDACAVPAAGVIGESLLALVLAEAVLDKFGGDSILEVSERIESWKRKSPIE